MLNFSLGGGPPAFRGTSGFAMTDYSAGGSNFPSSGEGGAGSPSTNNQGNGDDNFIDVVFGRGGVVGSINSNGVRVGVDTTQPYYGYNPGQQGSGYQSNIGGGTGQPATGLNKVIEENSNVLLLGGGALILLKVIGALK